MSRPKGTRARRLLRCAGVALGPVVLGSLLLTACGSVRAPAAGTAGAAPSGASGSPAAAGSGSGAAQATLCADPAAVTRLQIVRVLGPRVPEAQTAFPRQYAVIGPAGARAVARALCVLPVMPRGIMSCPAMFPGTSYQLHFTAAGRPLPAVTLEATGCDTVTGAGQVRRATSAAFWRVLATAAGLSPPGQRVFVAPSCEPHGYPTKINGCPGVSQPNGGLVPGGADQPAG
jgi:predicted small secreted protein